jgi:hypothetical protein
MSVKSICLAGLAAVLLGLGQARAQPSMTPYGSRSGPPSEGAAPTPGDAAPPAAAPAPLQTLSDWIIYPRGPGCCGPVGGDGPIGTQLYLRSGVSIPTGDGMFERTLHAGWDIEGGVRALFFNPAQDAAWTVDLGITNIFQNGDKRTKFNLINFPVTTTQGGTPTIENTFPVSVRSLNRTFVDLAAGREWYLLGGADCSCQGPNVRAGFDFGGRYGSEKINFEETHHRTDTIGGVFVALHADVECPCCGACILLAGGRVEWDYTWNDIFGEPTRSDIEDLNLMFNFGVRY